MTQAQQNHAALISSGLVPNISAFNNRTIKSDMHKISQAVGQAVYSMSYCFESPIGIDNIATAVDQTLTPSYVQWINQRALNARSSFYHMYEPNHIGESQARLFDFKIQKGRGAADFTANITFRPSKMIVPITALQAEPGPTGKSVQERHTFYNKAYVLEYGLPIVIRPRNGRHLVYESPRGSLVFRGGKKLPKMTFDTKTRPTFGAMHAANYAYFGRVGNGVIDRTLRRYANRVAKKSEQAATINLSVTMASNQQAQSIAKAVARSLRGVQL
jgi:hypothetical protein